MENHHPKTKRPQWQPVSDGPSRSGGFAVCPSKLGGVHYASIRDGRMLIPYATRNTGYSSADKPFASLVLVRGTDDNT